MGHGFPVSVALWGEAHLVRFLFRDDLQTYGAQASLYLSVTNKEASEGVRCWEVHLYRRGESDRLVGVLCAFEPLGVLVCWVESGLCKEL